MLRGLAAADRANAGKVYPPENFPEMYTNDPPLT
jgi:hypothetical protein